MLSSPSLLLPQQSPQSLNTSQNQIEQMQDAVMETYNQWQLKESQQDQVFYDCFKNQVVNQQLADLVSQLQMGNSLKSFDKLNALRILNNMTRILKMLGQQQSIIKIKLNRSVYDLQRDTMRLIEDAYQTYFILERAGSCGKDSITKQLDLQIRKIDQYCFFWENLALMDNRFQFTKDNLNSIGFKQQIEQCIQNLKSQCSPSIIEKVVESVPPKSLYCDSRLCEAHELYFGWGREMNKLGAFAIYQDLSKEKNGTALAIMGQILFEGTILPKDINQAFDYFKQSAQCKNIYSLYTASKLILEGQVTDKFYDENDLKLLSQNVQGTKIRGKEYDCSFAVAMLKQGAAWEHVPSMVYLGDIFANGYKIQNDLLIDPDLNQAEYYYKEAKSMKSVEALHKLAKLYHKMSKIPVFQNRSQHIIPLLTEAKNQDYLPAYYDLYTALMNGILDVVPSNNIMAELILEQGAFKGDKVCLKKYLSLQFEYLSKQELELSDFIELLDRLAEQDENKGLTYYYRGLIHLKGTQTDINLRQAKEYFRLGMNVGCIKSKQVFENLQQSKEVEDVKSSSKVSSQFQHSSTGLLNQIKQSDWKKYPRRPQKSVFSNLIEDQSSIQERNTRMTISIIRPADNSNPDRRRGISDYTGLQHNLEQSVLLSQLKLQLPPQTQRQTMGSSPAQNQAQFCLGGNGRPTITSSTARQTIGSPLLSPSNTANNQFSRRDKFLSNRTPSINSPSLKQHFPN